MKEYLLFDLDGTLTDPKVGITTCVQYALKAFGIEEPDLDKLEPFIGPPLKDSFMQFYQMSEEQAEAAVEKYRERFKDIGLFENEVYEGVPQMLRTLKRKGMHLAVASSKPTVYVQRILEHFGMNDYFEAIVGSELDGRRVNKDEVVEEALRQLFGDKSVEYEKVYMIGDRKFDVDGAHALNVESIGVSYGYGSLKELKEAGADYIVQSVSELNYILLREFREVEPRGVFQIGIPFVGALLFYTVSAMIGNNILWTIATIVLIFPLAIGLMRQAKYDMYVANVRKAPPIAYLVTLCTAIAILVGTHILTDLFGGVFGPKISLTTEIMATASLWKKLICVGVLVPVLEELVFRGVVYNVFRFKVRLSLAMCISAFLYTFFQMGLERTPYLIILGYLLAYTYEYFGTFVMPLLVHMVCCVAWVLICHFKVCSTGLHNWPMCIVLLLMAILGIAILNKEKKII